MDRALEAHVLPAGHALAPYADFAAASRATLAFLQARLGMGLWVVTRVADDDWVMLETARTDPRYALATGDVLRWSDSICSRMVVGKGPKVVPDVGVVPVYREAPIVSSTPIGAYVGYPLCNAEGDLLGTLCAIDPDARPSIEGAEPLIELAGRLLATVLHLELQAAAEARRREAAEAEAMLDELTGLWNRRAWDRFVVAEEARCKRHGTPVCVLSVDVDGLKRANDTEGHAAGDAMIRGVAEAIRESTRGHDVVARLGGDEFGALLIACGEEQALGVARRVRESLVRRGLEASIGLAKRDPRRDLADAQSRADAAMYADKAARKAGRA